MSPSWDDTAYSLGSKRKKKPKVIIKAIASLSGVAVKGDKLEDVEWDGFASVVIVQSSAMMHIWSMGSQQSRMAGMDRRIAGDGVGW